MSKYFLSKDVVVFHLSMLYNVVKNIKEEESLLEESRGVITRGARESNWKD